VTSSSGPVEKNPVVGWACACVMRSGRGCGRGGGGGGGREIVVSVS